MSIAGTTEQAITVENQPPAKPIGENAERYAPNASQQDRYRYRHTYLNWA
jgi:hypothetical protein